MQTEQPWTPRHSGDVLDEIEGLIDDGVLERQLGRRHCRNRGSPAARRLWPLATWKSRPRPSASTAFAPTATLLPTAFGATWMKPRPTSRSTSASRSLPSKTDVEGKLSFGGSFVRTERTQQEDAFTFAASGQFFDNFEGVPFPVLFGPQPRGLPRRGFHSNQQRQQSEQLRRRVLERLGNLRHVGCPRQ